MKEVSDDPKIRFNQILDHISSKLDPSEDFGMDVLIEIMNIIFDNVVGLTKETEKLEGKTFTSTTLKFENLEELKNKMNENRYIGLVKFYTKIGDIYLECQCFGEDDIPKYLSNFKSHRDKFVSNMINKITKL